MSDETKATLTTNPFTGVTVQRVPCEVRWNDGVLEQRWSCVTTTFLWRGQEQYKTYEEWLPVPGSGSVGPDETPIFHHQV